MSGYGATRVALVPLGPPDHGYQALTVRMADIDVGFVGLLQTPGTHIAHIRVLIVCGQQRGKGLGTLVVEQLCRMLSDGSVHAVEVRVSAGMERALGFWQASGFRVQSLGSATAALRRTLRNLPTRRDTSDGRRALPPRRTWPLRDFCACAGRTGGTCVLGAGERT